MKQQRQFGFVLLVPLAFLVVLAIGCPPLRFEDVYGYNSVILRNRGDRAILALFIIAEDQPGRGPNYVQGSVGLPPRQSLTVSELRNGVYDLEIEYMLSAVEVYAGSPVRVVERLSDVSLYWGASFTWHWYGPSEEVLAEAQQNK